MAEIRFDLIAKERKLIAGQKLLRARESDVITILEEMVAALQKPAKTAKPTRASRRNNAANDTDTLFVTGDPDGIETRLDNAKQSAAKAAQKVADLEKDTGSFKPPQRCGYCICF